MKEFGKKGAISRRSFLAALGLAGASAAGAGLAGCAPKPEAIIDGLALATQILKEKRGAKE